MTTTIKPVNKWNTGQKVKEQLFSVIEEKDAINKNPIRKSSIWDQTKNELIILVSSC